ncbi:MAG TPA: Minf_1886 family protein [Isosphaeraceae bacterium]|jgi:uncharacterized repeat protein (TIGR04138 family)
MSLRADLAGVLARDPRYSIQAYAFVLEALEFAKNAKKRNQPRGRGRKSRPPEESRHVSGQELCQGARLLAVRHYGYLALTVLNQWGIRSTSDLGEIVYNLIAAGDLEKTAADRRSDFDDVFDFEATLKRDFVLVLEDSA